MRVFLQAGIGLIAQTSSTRASSPSATASASIRYPIGKHACNPQLSRPSAINDQTGSGHQGQGLATFAHRHYDEIGIADDTDIAALANALISIGGVFEEGTDPRFLLVDTVRFV